MPIDKSRGGHREGAGRKPLIGGKVVRRSVTLTPEDEKMLEKLGDGNLSLGIKRLVEQSAGKKD